MIIAKYSGSSRAATNKSKLTYQRSGLEDNVLTHLSTLFLAVSFLLSPVKQYVDTSQHCFIDSSEVTLKNCYYFNKLLPWYLQSSITYSSKSNQCYLFHTSTFLFILHGVDMGVLFALSLLMHSEIFWLVFNKTRQTE